MQEQNSEAQRASLLQAGALFRDRAQADAAIRDLQSAGFGAETIRLATRERSELDGRQEVSGVSRSSFLKGLLIGGGIGAVIGVIIAIAAQNVPGVLDAPVYGVLVDQLGFGVANILGHALTGAFVGAVLGAMFSGAVHAEQDEAQQFERGMDPGHVFITVDTADRVAEANAILQRAGGDIGPEGAGKTSAGDRPLGGRGEALGGGVAGAGVGGIIGSVVGGPLGSVPGGLLGAVLGTLVGWWIGRIRNVERPDKADLGASGGAAAGGATGAAIGTAIAGPAGTVIGAAIGGTVGAAGAAAAGAQAQQDEREIVDEHGRRVTAVPVDQLGDHTGEAPTP